MKRKLLCLLLYMLLVTTEAQAAEKPNAAVDTSRSCTLTLQYAASGQTVQLYRAADISSNGRYTLCGAFAGYGIFMPAGNGQAEWDALRDNLLAYISADALAPDGTAVTGADGRAVFTGLSAGMYLVVKAVMEVGHAKSVHACASHGVLSGPAIERINASVITELALLDTIPAIPEGASDKIKYLTVAPMFAEAIERIYQEISISKLFR